jgi:hypothetical protein
MDNFAYANRTMSMLLGCEQVGRCYSRQHGSPQVYLLLQASTLLLSIYVLPQTVALGDLMVHRLSSLTGSGSVGSAAGAAGKRVVRLHRETGPAHLSPTAAE